MTVKDGATFVFREGGSWLVWDTDGLCRLRRECGVVGALRGTSPWYPTQHDYLSLPAELMGCEVRWCVERGACRAVRAIFTEEMRSGELGGVETARQKIEDGEWEWEDEKVVVDEREFLVYTYLREHGLWVVDGSGYGATFAAYPGPPWETHSEALVWVDCSSLPPASLVRRVRIAEGTRKTAVVASVGAGGVRLVTLCRPCAA